MIRKLAKKPVEIVFVSFLLLICMRVLNYSLPNHNVQRNAQNKVNEVKILELHHTFTSVCMCRFDANMRLLTLRKPSNGASVLVKP